MNQFLFQAPAKSRGFWLDILLQPAQGSVDQRIVSLLLDAADPPRNC